MAHATLAGPGRQARRLRDDLAQAPGLPFADLLPADQVRQALDDEAVTFRDRLFSPVVTLWVFLSQVLDPDGSCRAALGRFLAWRAARKLPPCSGDTSAYCKARARLPEGVLARLARQVGRQVQDEAPPHWRWQGRTVKVVDGSTVSMPDTPDNQAAYPQTGSWPWCASAGPTWSRACTSAAGPTSAPAAGWGARTMSSRGTGRHARAGWQTYAALPATLDVREVRVRVGQPGFRTRVFVAVTTLLDAEASPRADVAVLYRMRWLAELDLRALKQALQMDVLRCKTPGMVRKEVWAHLLAYNLVRGLMAQAAREAKVLPVQLSFTGAVQAVNAFAAVWQAARPGERAEVAARLRALVAGQRVGDRPNRSEPRARKRRPKEYPLLKHPRQQARKLAGKGRYD